MGFKISSKLLYRVLISGLALSAGLVPCLSEPTWAAKKQAQPNTEAILLLNVAANTQTLSGKTVQAKVMIDAPPDLVWNTLTNYSELKHILPGYEKSQVIKSAKSEKQVAIAMKVSPFLPLYHYEVIVRENEPAYLLNLNRLSGDFKSLSATYKLLSQNNGTRTLLSYQLNIDPGFNFPGAQNVIRSSTEKSLHALERHIELEAKKSVIGQR